MAENYIVINGKKAELTPEQLKALGLEMEINSFERKDYYYFIDTQGRCVGDDDGQFTLDIGRYNAANYCTDREMMEQRALHETLNRLLWRYSMEHGGREIDWNDRYVEKYRITYNYETCVWCVYWNSHYNNIGTPYFLTREIAENAIKEIVKPFMAEHPDFKL